jgi:uncharacterized FlaG/YvyC family protein
MEVYSIKSHGNNGSFELISPSSFSPKQGRVNQYAERHSAAKTAAAGKEIKTPVKHSTSKPDYPRMTDIAHKVRKKLQSINVNIQFEVNRDQGKIVIKVIDPASGEVVRKIPPEKFMKSVEFLNDMKNELHAEGIEVDVKY